QTCALPICRSSCSLCTLLMERNSMAGISTRKTRLDRSLIASPRTHCRRPATKPTPMSRNTGASETNTGWVAMDMGADLIGPHHLPQGSMAVAHAAVLAQCQALAGGLQLLQADFLILAGRQTPGRRLVRRGDGTVLLDILLALLLRMLGPCRQCQQGNQPQRSSEMHRSTPFK